MKVALRVVEVTLGVDQGVETWVSQPGKIAPSGSLGATDDLVSFGQIRLTSILLKIFNFYGLGNVLEYK